MYSLENKSEESRAFQSNSEKQLPTAQFKDNQAQSPIGTSDNTVQREKRANLTGMPDDLKSGIESLSGFSMDDVRVHYNSSKPATVQALAYTQGTDIHVAPGQEKHLPHEAWHVAQQMAGRVSPTTNINGMPVNDNAELEHEADVMGAKAVQRKKEFVTAKQKGINVNVFQGKITIDGNVNVANDMLEKINDEIGEDKNGAYGFLNKKNLLPVGMYNRDVDKLKTVKNINDIKNRYRSRKIFLNLPDEGSMNRQVAQDIILQIHDYRDLIGIPHQYDDFSRKTLVADRTSGSREKKSVYDEKTLADVREKTGRIFKLYRTIKNGKPGYTVQDRFGYDSKNNIPYTRIDLLGGGHLGSIGVALYYYNSWKNDFYVNLIEISIENGLDVDGYVLGSQGEGVDAKTEGTSILPQSSEKILSLLAKSEKLGTALADGSKVSVKSILSNNCLLRELRCGAAVWIP